MALVVPDRGGPLLMHGSAPLIALYLYYSAGTTNCRSARVLRGTFCSSLGHYAVPVVLFQDPLRYVFQAVDGMEDVQLPFFSANVLCCFMLCLWTISGLYYEYVDVRLQRWLERMIDELEDDDDEDFDTASASE
eukprot:TRINITY_DN49499_c0_g1_i2.p1 TRINITY_DN49499_c0_g1~~TRINITY_DN49499_c0_g1_i2.p1  ORF type:complete len:134 (-),score=24.58 TRINITY_DN49499_c0_g1_i2:23-424(-)